LPYILLFFIVEAAAGCNNRGRSNILLFLFVYIRDGNISKVAKYRLHGA
jgi:hypothetical protein